uniref:Uncharacterized protein n=1 Tax=Aegilops tauschii TaxID=37682 RepID=R7WBI4_AEGTA
MAVSFWVADPPQLSLFSIGCSKPHDLHHSKHANFRNLPNVVGAEGRLVLLRAAFAEHYGVSEYFLYKAAGDAGEPPSLQRIPSPYENDDGDDLRGSVSYFMFVYGIFFPHHLGHLGVALECHRSKLFKKGQWFG